MDPLALMLVVGVTAAAVYAVVAERDERCLFSAAAAIVLTALLMLERGFTVASALHLSLAAGFLASAGFLAPRLGGSLRTGWSVAGAIAALILLMVLVYRSPETATSTRVEGWAPVILALAVPVVVASLASIRVLVVGGGR